MTDQVKKTGQRLAASEPVTRFHSKTNVDTALMATIAIEVARTSLMVVAPFMAGVYIVCWVVLAIKTAV